MTVVTTLLKCANYSLLHSWGAGYCIHFVSLVMHIIINTPTTLSLNHYTRYQVQNVTITEQFLIVMNINSNICLLQPAACDFSDSSDTRM